MRNETKKLPGYYDESEIRNLLVSALPTDDPAKALSMLIEAYIVQQTQDDGAGGNQFDVDGLIDALTV